MKRFSIALLLFAAGCTGHQPRWYSETVSASSIDKLAGVHSEVTLRDGSTVLLVRPADYVGALCDRYTCVRKAEITRIRIADHNGNNNDSMALAVLFAPATAAGMLAANAKMGHDAGERDGTASTPRIPAQPAVTPPMKDPELEAIRQRDQQASNNLQAEENKALGFLREGCQAVLPVDITSLDPALIWLHANRMAIPDGYCLDLAAAHTGRRKLSGYLDRELQLHILGIVRSRWLRVQCAGATDINRIVPLEDLKGASIPQLDFIRQTLADEASYVLPHNFSAQCENGLADPATVPDIRMFAAIVDPFSRPGAAQWLRDRRSGDLN